MAENTETQTATLSAPVQGSKAAKLRQGLVELALDWEAYFGVLPRITDAISELDAAFLVGMTEAEYCAGGAGKTAVTKGRDFYFNGLRYQVTANRPSGKPGSPVTKASLKKPDRYTGEFGWDRLMWLLYDRLFILQEAWEFTAKEYRDLFSDSTRVGPREMRKGRCLYPSGRGAHDSGLSKLTAQSPGQCVIA